MLLCADIGLSNSLLDKPGVDSGEGDCPARLVESGLSALIKVPILTVCYYMRLTYCSPKLSGLNFANSELLKVLSQVPSLRTRTCA